MQIYKVHEKQTVTRRHMTTLKSLRISIERQELLMLRLLRISKAVDFSQPRS